MVNFDVSIVIPTYNRVSMLQEALDSVASQDFSGSIETIVVDDNSQDGTSDIISQNYPEVRLISLKENVGPAAARNRGILQAEGKYIAFLDSDDLWQPNYLTVQVEALESSNQCFCVSDLVLWDTVKNQKRVVARRPDLEKYTSPIHELLVASFIRTPSCVVIPRQLFDKAGLFDENFVRGGEDPELYIRCLISGYNIVFSGKAVVIKREHEQAQLTSSIRRQGQDRFMRIRKFYSSSLPEEFMNMVPKSQQVYAECHAFLARLYLANNDYFSWLASRIFSAYYAPGFALSNLPDVKRDIRTINKNIKRDVKDIIMRPSR